MSLLYTNHQGHPPNLIILKIQHTDGQEFKIFFEEKIHGAETTVQQFIPTTISLSSINSLSQEIYSILYKSTNDPENITENTEQSLQEVGHELYNLIFPIQIKENLASSDFRNLCLTIDQSLIGIPWELLFDGREFFCLRFNMGRIVYTSHPTIRAKIPDLQKIHMLILADPKKDLPKSYKEGEDLYRRLENWSDALDVTLLTSNIDTQTISRRIFEGNILHYAGHAEYNTDNPGESGWLLEDGIFTAQKIKQLAGSKKAFPSLVFSNACRSGQTSEWPKKQSDHQGIYQAFDLVDAFLLSGVQHYIGTFQEVRDISSLSFALNFYGFMVQSYPIGEALRKARLKLKGESGKSCNNLIWAYYMLYGDPNVSYLQQKGLQLNPEPIQSYNLPQDKNSRQNYTSNGSSKRTGSSKEDEKTSDPDNDSKPRIKINIKGIKKYKWIAVTFAYIIILLIMFSILLVLFIPPKRLPLELPSKRAYYITEWEENKWQIIQKIQERLNQRYSDNSKKGYADIHPKNQPYSSQTNIICIMPSISYVKKEDIDTRITIKLIEELGTFFMGQKDWIVVERDRLDFVLQELERATSQLSQNKLQFALGEILGARGILFVLALKKPALFPFLGRKSDIFLRYVETQTSAINAKADAIIKESDIKRMGSILGEEILLALEKNSDDNKI